MNETQRSEAMAIMVPSMDPNYDSWILVDTVRARFPHKSDREIYGIDTDLG